jgi:hypothetical protein
MVLSQVMSRSLLNIINDRILRIQMNTALSQSRIIWWGVNIVLEFTPSSITNMNCCFFAGALWSRDGHTSWRGHQLEKGTYRANGLVC